MDKRGLPNLNPMISPSPIASRSVANPFLQAQITAGAADLTTHAALTTAVHGAGGSTLATTANIATHAALTDTHGTFKAVLPYIVCFEDQVICNNNEVVWS